MLVELVELVGFAVFGELRKISAFGKVVEFGEYGRDKRHVESFIHLVFRIRQQPVHARQQSMTLTG